MPKVAQKQGWNSAVGTAIPANYDDTIAAGEAALVTAAVNVLDDFNGLRSQVNRTIGLTNWYDAAPNTGFDGGPMSTAKFLNNFMCSAQILTDITVPGGQNFYIIDVSNNEQPTVGGNDSVAANGTEEGAAVELSTLAPGDGVGDFGVTFELTLRTNTSDGGALSPLNIASVIDSTTRQAIQSDNGNDVLALLVAESTFTPNGGTFDDSASGNRLKLCFVRINTAGLALEPCPVADIAGKTINYNYGYIKILGNVDPACFTGARVFVDQTASVDVTRQNAYANQAALAFTTGDTATMNIGSGLDWIIGDSAGTAAFTFDESVGASTIALSSAVATFDSEAVVNDFANSIIVETDVGTGMTFGVLSGKFGVFSELATDLAISQTVEGANGITVSTAASSASVNSGTITVAAGGVSTVGAIVGGDVLISTGTVSGAASSGSAGDITLSAGGVSGVGATATAGNIVLTAGSDSTVGATGVNGTVDVSTGGGANVSEADAVLRLLNAGGGTGGGEDVQLFTGTSNPNGIVTADRASMFFQDVGASSATIWINESAGVTGTVWTALSTGSVENRQDVYGNQGVTVVDLTTNATLEAGTGLTWIIRDEADTALVSVGTQSTTVIGASDGVVATDAGTGISILAGDGLTSGVGGNVDITAGDSGNVDTTVGGSVNITGGTSSATNAPGGDIVLASGKGVGTGVNGEVELTNGVMRASSTTEAFQILTGAQAVSLVDASIPNILMHSADSATLQGASINLNTAVGGNGSATLLGGSGISGVTAGASATVQGGAGFGAAFGGQAALTGGAGGATSGGGFVFATGGAGGATSGDAGGVTLAGGIPVDGNGGGITLTGSDGVGTNRDGGDVTVTSGVSTGSGVTGTIFLKTAAGGASISETDAIVSLENQGTGTGGGQDAQLFTGESDPNATVTADAGSLFMQDTEAGSGTPGNLYVNASLSGAAGTIWNRVLTTADDVAETRQEVYDNQGVTVVDLLTNATLEVGTGLTWIIRDEANTALVSVGTQSTTVIGASDGVVATDAGSDISILAGDGLTSGVGGDIGITAGDSGNVDTTVGGSVTITGGTSSATNAPGGDIVLASGKGVGTGVNGEVELTNGVMRASSTTEAFQILTGAQAVSLVDASIPNILMHSADSATLQGASINLNTAVGGNGSATLQGGSGISGVTAGASATVQGGAGFGAAFGGQAAITGGAGGATSGGGFVFATGGVGGATSGDAGGVTLAGGVPVDGNGGGITLTGSDGVGTNRDGGDVTVTSGVSTGSGVTGTIFLKTAAGGASISETDAIVSLENQGTGTGGGQDAQVFTGESDPNATVTADAGSLFLRDTEAGSGSPGSLWINSSLSGAAGTVWEEVATSVTVAALPRQEPVTTQAVTGTDTALTDVLDAVPVSNASVRLFLNGVEQRQGAGADYTVSSTTITWLASTGTAVDMDTTDVLDAIYDSAA